MSARLSRRARRCLRRGRRRCGAHGAASREAVPLTSALSPGGEAQLLATSRPRRRRRCGRRCRHARSPQHRWAPGQRQGRVPTQRRSSPRPPVRRPRPRRGHKPHAGPGICRRHPRSHPRHRRSGWLRGRRRPRSPGRAPRRRRRGRRPARRSGRPRRPRGGARRPGPATRRSRATPPAARGCWRRAPRLRAAWQPERVCRQPACSACATFQYCMRDEAGG